MKRQYKITNPLGEVTITDSLSKFANEVGIYYGQFYTALHKGTKTRKGDYRVEWHKEQPVEEKPENTQFKITDPIGIVHYTDSYTNFAKSIGVKVHGFRKVLRGVQNTCYGGYIIERVDDNKVTEKEEIPSNKKITDHVKVITEFYKDKVSEDGEVEILDIIREGNTHKVKFKNTSGNIHTRKIDLKKVNNLQGQKCNYSGVIIPMNNLSASCNDGKDTYTFSVDKLKQLGYSFDIDFSTPKVVEKIVEKKVEVFSADLLQEQLQDKMESLIKEIKFTQTRLTKLKTMKENLGKSLSQITFANNNIKSVDNLLEEKVNEI